MKSLAIIVFTFFVLCTNCHASDPILATFSPEVSGLKKVKLSTSGTMGFRILKKEDKSVLIGGRGVLLTLNHDNPEDPQVAREEFQTCDNGNAFFQCKDQASVMTDRDCHNFIRMAEDLSNNLLLVCGTNALNPRCYVCNVTRSRDMGIQDISCPGPRESTPESPCVVSQSEGLGTLDGSDIAPKHWERHATSLHADGKLFLGVAKRNGKTVVSRVDVNLAGPNGSETAFTDSLETTNYLSRSVNEADFVGKPFIVGDRAYFFYREIAVEHISEGNMVYSRVARVCKDDTGSGIYWSSFQKARLNCSIPGAFPSYYNEIQDIIVKNGSDSEHYIHAVFSGLGNGPQGSAVCVYRLSDIDAIFDTGYFHGPLSQQSLWLPIANTRVPTPRPGLSCNTPSRDRSFFQQFPLMQQLAMNYNAYGPSDSPVFSVDDRRLTALEMDTTPAGNIYYATTDSGSILKAYHDGQSFKVYEFAVTEDHQPLVGLHLTGEGASRHLVAVSDNSIYNLPLQNCATSCQRKCSELLRGYCVWQEGCCREIGASTCPETTSDVHVSLFRDGPITACENERVQLYCQAQAGPLCPEVRLAWTRDGGRPIDKLGHLIALDPLYGHATNKLSLMTVHAAIARNTTEIECTGSLVDVGGTRDAVTRAAQIEIKHCITDGSLRSRYEKHRKLQEENKKSKRCNVNVFDCANCQANANNYAVSHTEF